MSKILITGNGFDLFHHLPTKYGHFMAVMETIEKNKFNTDRIKFEDLFGNFFKERFNKDYESIKESYSTEMIFFEKDKMLEIIEFLKLNSWFKHFKNVNDINTWIDFESEIKFVLDSISKIFEELESKNDFNYYYKRKIKIYLDLSCFNLISKDDGDCVILKDEYLDLKNNKIKEKEILNILSNSLNQFIELFNKYLVNVSDIFYNEIRQNDRLLLKNIDKFYTVNYTATLEKICGVKEDKIIYLHGKSSEKNQNLVLGIDEIPDKIKPFKVFNFSKYFQKIYKNTNHNIFDDFIKVDLTKNSHYNEKIQFVIIGHSLDKSDKYLLEKIFNIIKIDSTKRAFLTIFYYNDEDKLNKLNNLFSIFEIELLVSLNSENRLRFVELNSFNLMFELSIDISGNKVVF